MNPIRAGSASQYPSPCVGLDWRAVTESDRAVLLEEDVRWERGYHTWCEPLLGLAMEAKILPKREPSVQHVEGSLKAPRRAAAPRSPLPASEKVTRTSRYFRVGITFPLAASPIDPRLATKVRSTGRRWEPVNQFLLLHAVVGWTGCRP
jgi:hypothetical protein